MGNRAAKGSQFEREICRQLSLWWSGGKADDLFWRTSNSGGRATTRHKSGKSTRSHHGDVTATDAFGQPFIRMFCLEIKRGYNRASVMDLLDQASGSKKPLYQEWFEKVDKTRKKAGAISWMLIVRRDRKIPIVFMPTSIFRELTGTSAELRFRSISAMPLTDFFGLVEPDIVRNSRHLNGET